MLRWLVVLGLWLACSTAAAQTQLGWHSKSPPAARVSLGQHSGRFARAASIVGVVSAGLLFGGSVAIGVADHRESERVTRGLQLGYTVVAAPFVALGAFSARRRAGILGGRASLRTMGWIAYTAAVANGVAQWYGAFHDAPTSRGLTITGGVLAAMSLLPHAFDAYLCARHARLRDLGLTFSGLGLSARF